MRFIFCVTLSLLFSTRDGGEEGGWVAGGSTGMGGCWERGGREGNGGGKAGLGTNDQFHSLTVGRTYMLKLIILTSIVRSMQKHYHRKMKNE